MGWQLLEELKSRIEQTIRLSQLDNLMKEISSLLEQNKLTPEEYDYLLYLKKKQFPIILKLNLIPNRQLILRRLEEQFFTPPSKVDPGEILEEEFEIIAQELMNLNLARIDYIKTNYN